MTVSFPATYTRNSATQQPVLRFGAIKDYKHCTEQKNPETYRGENDSKVSGKKPKLRDSLFGLTCFFLTLNAVHDHQLIRALAKQNKALSQTEASLTRHMQAISRKEATMAQQVRTLSEKEKGLTQKVATLEASTITPDVIARVAPATVTIEMPDGSNGSGVFFSPDGLILTKAHVIGSKEEFSANKLDKKKAHRCKILSYTGKDDPPVTGYAELLKLKNGKLAWDGKKDLAVLKIKPPFAGKIQVQHSIPLDQFRNLNKDELKPGEKVFAIGAPKKYADTITQGIVSHASVHITDKNNGTPQDARVFQTDTACNPGNSGGGSFDSQGRLVGIQDSIENNAEGICYASRVDEIIRWLEQIGLIQKTGQTEK